MTPEIPIDLSGLVKAIKTPSAGLRLRLGAVTAVNSDYSVDIQIAGSTNTLPSVKVFDNFIPAIGIQVWLLTLGSDILGIGKVAKDVALPTIASATTIAPTTPAFFVSGTTAIATITRPNFIKSGDALRIIPTGIWTFNTAGNIAVAVTSVVNRANHLIWDSGAGKWYPTYLS